MVTSDPAARPTGASADALPGPQGIDGVDVEEVGDAAAILARGVAISTRLHAAAAGELEAGTATGARAIAEGAEVIQATAQDRAREAAQRALHAVEAVAEALGAVGGAGAFLTPEQAIVVVAKASEAAAQLAIAARASGAFAMAATATGLATQAADYAAAFELHMIATAVAAQELAEEATDASRPHGHVEAGTEPS